MHGIRIDIGNAVLLAIEGEMTDTPQNVAAQNQEWNLSKSAGGSG
jgi:hypothetical protein